MTLPQPVADLVDRFHRNRDAYLSGQYNETQVRREFIDPMFESLGWDMNNCQGYAEAYKDVIHEDAIKIGGATKFYSRNSVSRFAIRLADNSWHSQIASDDQPKARRAARCVLSRSTVIDRFALQYSVFVFGCTRP